MTAPVLQAEGLTKSYPGVRALRGVGLSVQSGEVLAVIGENGAGKSTLMKILAGVQPPDSGEIRISGAPVRLRSVQEAQALGIALIHQELNLAENLDVADNLFLGRERLRHGLIDTRRQHAEARQHLAKVGLDVEPSVPVGTLSLGQRQLVEIAKALSVDARVVIFDEPTSSLSSGEAANLFRVIRDLRSRGVAVIYISHRLGEVKELADRVVVLRDGENAGELPRDEIHHAAMVRLMVGRDLTQFYAHQPLSPGRPMLEVDGLRTAANPRHPLQFRVHAGEIVGVAGLVGAGRTEMLEALFGVTPALGGVVRVDGVESRPESPQDAIRAGLALVPEDRKRQGVILEMAVRENVSLAALRRDSPRGFLNRLWENSLAAETIRNLRVKTPSPLQSVQFLSGGNQQKVVLGKWLALKPKVLLMDEPTRGIDVGAKHEIYRLMEDLAREGVAILFVSSELEEVLGLSDRVLVLHEGRITGELPRSALNEEAVLHLATDTSA
ncbi:MAG: sugar ABC transporter ATP-binding protein [Verrucomicrobiales bacterium]|nr:sugar ABC transporter ATP-binding protein [Verrucomicrobiales bacterium]